VPRVFLGESVFTITLLTRLLDQIRSVTGLPEAIEQKITALATLNRAAWATLPDRRADAETAAVAALIEAASTGKPLPAHVEAKVTEAASLDASSDAQNRLVRRAVAVAENDLLVTARDHADEIVTGRLCPKMEKALECLPDAARLIPAGMDEASAFRAAGEVQNAYRKLLDAAELVDRVVEIRRQMCNNAGNAAAIDFPSPNVFSTPSSSAGYGTAWLPTSTTSTKPAPGQRARCQCGSGCSRCTEPGRSFTSRPARKSRRWSRPMRSATARTIPQPSDNPKSAWSVSEKR